MRSRSLLIIALTLMFSLSSVSGLAYAGDSTHSITQTNGISQNVSIAPLNVGVSASQKITIYFFYGQGCPHCAAIEPYIKSLAAKYPQVTFLWLEIWYNHANYLLFKDFCARFHITNSAVPAIFIQNVAGLIGETAIQANLQSIILRLIGASFTVTAPNGGNLWIRGTTHMITWTSAGSPGAYVKIELLKAGVVSRVISSSTPNDGSYSWTIPSTQTLGTDYKIRIMSTSKTTITDSSNSNFAIVTGTLTVTSPNGGQIWIRGITHPITWTSAGSPGAYVKIELLKAGVVSRVISSSTPNHGSYSWTIPSTQTLGTDYKIRITSTTYYYISDPSNGNFKITA